MYDTTKAMIENLGSVVERYGFIPNGGRVYYLQRSHPPLLAGMLYEYYEATEDKDFMKSMLSIIEKELQFWENNRKVNVTINGVVHTVFRYSSRSNMPRPESYLVDIQKAQSVADKTRFWQDVASAAESGWDFSTRWFGDKRTIYTIETTNVSKLHPFRVFIYAQIKFKVRLVITKTRVETRSSSVERRDYNAYGS
ncbi:alpha,alpha-trehalase [Teladorsagia circumcincta]|uniref:Trehalase n=1 Tax=Teladorsagia circumcincta TaxID=45464 RepID=A0A2G9TXR9_TELCI|nr:alpha,alpha-trehalase [Teladorsagia circumcincta]